MITIRGTALAMSGYISQELGTGPKDTDIIRYGLEILIGTFIKGIVIIALSTLLHLTPLVMVTALSSGILRLSSGGAHLRTYSRCLVFGTALMLLSGWLARMAESYVNLAIAIILIGITFFSGLLFTEKWAPADTRGKPITNPAKRKKYKNLAWLTLYIWVVTLVIYLLINYKRVAARQFALAGTGGIIIQLMSISPGGYRFINNVDRLLSKILP